MKLLALIVSLVCAGSNLFAEKVGLLIVATGKYDSFVAPLIDSARRHFCSNHEVTYYVFTDGNIPEAQDIVRVQQEKLGWPYDTLMRNSIYLDHKDLFSKEDYVFALDADMLFVDTVGEEIFGERVATLHPGYAITRKKLPYETSHKSTAYIPKKYRKGGLYFAGGFFGGSRDGFTHIIQTTTERILKDLNKGVIAIWHDESQWNRYCIDYRPTVILNPSYCYADPVEIGYSHDLAEVFKNRFPKKLLALTKNHKEYRE